MIKLGLHELNKFFSKLIAMTERLKFVKSTHVPYKFFPQSLF